MILGDKPLISEVVLSQKPLGWFFAGLVSKSVATVSGGLISKSDVTVSNGLASKPVAMVFSSLASKLVATVSPGLASKLVVGFLVEPQNQGGGGFPGLDLKIGSFDLVIWSSKSPRLLLGLSHKPSKLRFVCCATKLMEGGQCGTRIEI
jgi:hypothetical protein